MSDIRFNNWKHQSGTGGVTQNAAGNVGIGSTLPTSALDIGGDTNITGVTTASNFKTGSSNLHSAGVEVAGVKSDVRHYIFFSYLWKTCSSPYCFQPCIFLSD